MFDITSVLIEQFITYPARGQMQNDIRYFYLIANSMYQRERYRHWTQIAFHRAMISAQPSKNAVSAFQISCKLLSFTMEDS